jgi:hypothetical protein
MARKKVVKRRVRNNKGGGFYLPRTTPDPDALFTMVLSAHKFFDDNFKTSGLKIDSKLLLKNIMSAVEKTFMNKSAKANVPEYNVAADALAAAYLAHSSGDKANSRQMIKIAFSSPDCEKLMDALAGLNTDAEGALPVFSEDMDGDADLESSNDSGQPPSIPPRDRNYNTNLETDVTAPMENIEDITGGGNSDSDENHGAENSPSEDREMKASRKKFLRKVKKVLKSANETFMDDDGDLMDENIGPENIPFNLRKKANKKSADLGDNATMRMQPASLPESIEHATPGGSFQDVTLLSKEDLKQLAASNPELIAIANKISALGNTDSKKLAVKFLSKVNKAA